MDDDGSGTVCVLEVFRVLMANGFKPNRTVEFHFYACVTRKEVFEKSHTFVVLRKWAF